MKKSDTVARLPGNGSHRRVTGPGFSRGSGRIAFSSPPSLRAGASPSPKGRRSEHSAAAAPPLKRGPAARRNQGDPVTLLCRKSWAIALAAGLFLAGCDGNPFNLTPVGGTNFGDEELTIRLMTFGGFSHITESEDWCRKTQAATGWANVRAIHRDGASDLIFGQYRSPDAAQADLKRAKGFKTPATGEKVYAAAMVVEIPGAKIGPPELDLAGTKAGVYTVQVAVYIDVPEQNIYGRRRLAVEAARQLRQSGWDAYYFHGSARSAVCIGLFGPEAVKVRPPRDIYVEKKVDPNAEVYDVLDPKLREILRKFPRLAVNGYEEKLKSWNTRTGKWEMVPSETCIIKIPRNLNASPYDRPRNP